MARKLWGFARRNALALIALFIALGGTAYALEANSVGSRQIKDGGVRERDLRDDAVSAGKLAPGAVVVPRKVDWRQNTVNFPTWTDLLVADGLHLQGLCTGAGGFTTIYIGAYSTTADNSIGWAFADSGSGIARGNAVGRRTLAGPSPTDDERILLAIKAPFTNRVAATGTLVYREPGPAGDADSSVVSVPLTIATENTTGSGGYCAVEGTATRATEPGVQVEGPD